MTTSVPQSAVVPHSRELPASVVRRLLEVARGSGDYPQEMVSTNITGLAPEKVVIFTTSDLPVRALRINVLNHREGTAAELPPYRRAGEFTDDGYYGLEPETYSDGHPESYKYQPVGEAFVPRPWWNAELGGPGGRSPYAGRSFAPVAPLPPGGSADLYERPVPMDTTPTAPAPQPVAAPPSQMGPAVEAFMSSDKDSEPSINGDDGTPRQPLAVDFLRGELYGRELMSVPRVRQLAEEIGDGTIASIFVSANGRYVVLSALDTLALSCITLANRYKHGREQRNVARERLHEERGRRRVADKEIEAARHDAAELRARVGELEDELEDARRQLQQATAAVRVVPGGGGEEAVQPGYSRRRARSPDDGSPERNVRTRLRSPVGAAGADTLLLARLDARIGSPESPDLSPRSASVPTVEVAAPAFAPSHGPVPAHRRGAGAVLQRGLRRNPTYARVPPRHPRPSTNVRAPAPAAPSASHRARPSSHYRR